MNHYSELLKYLKGLADADDFIHTVTHGATSEFDLDKGNVFPLLNIDVLSAGFSKGQMVSFDIEIACMDIRDANNETTTNKFWKQDNEVDNLNEMLASLNRIWFKMLQDITEQNIKVDDSANLQQVTEWNTNLVDGWLMTFTINLPNTTISLCS